MPPFTLLPRSLELNDAAWIGLLPLLFCIIVAIFLSVRQLSQF